MDPSTLTPWTGSFLIEGGLVSFLLLPCFLEITVFNTNSVGPNQTSHLCRLISVFTVSQCPFYGTPGIKMLNVTL